MEHNFCGFIGNSASLLNLCSFVATVVTAVCHYNDLLEEWDTCDTHFALTWLETLIALTLEYE